MNTFDTSSEVGIILLFFQPDVNTESFYIISNSHIISFINEGGLICVQFCIFCGIKFAYNSKLQ